MKLLKNKRQDAIKQLNDLVSFTGKKIFEVLKNCRSMGISIDNMLDDTDDYDLFMNNVYKFNNDYKEDL